MASWVQIANLALRRLGADRIAALGEDSEQGRAVNDVYELVRDNVLSKHPWNCALVRASLAADASAPAFGWEKQYTLPTDPYCLRVWRVGTYEADHASIPHKIERRKLLTDEGAPLKLLYIARITDPEEYPPGLAMAMAAALAAEIAFRLTNSRPAEDAMLKWAERALRSAKSSDAQEGTPEDASAHELENARL